VLMAICCRRARLLPTQARGPGAIRASCFREHFGRSSAIARRCAGHARRAAHRENRRRNHLSDARGVRSHRSSSAKIHHFRQRHRLRPARPAQDHARYDDLVLRRLCLMAKRRHRKRQWTLTSMAAAPPGYRPDIRPRHPRDRPHDQPHPPKMPRVQDAIPSLDC
jgi:hypothetical protein